MIREPVLQEAVAHNPGGTSMPNPAPVAASRLNVVRMVRSQLKLTQESLAHQLGVTVSTVNRWENHHAAPSLLALRALRALAAKYGIDLDTLGQ